MPITRLTEIAAQPMSAPLDPEPVERPIQLRGLAWLALSDTGHFLTRTIADDTGGGGIASWSYGDVTPCRIDPLSAREDVTASRISERSTHLVTVPPGTPVETDDRFLIDNRGTYEITGVQDRTGERMRFFEVVQVT